MARIYGEKYDPKLTVKEIAKLVKREIKDKYPGIKVSATTRNYNVINIKVWLPEDNFRAFVTKDLPDRGLYCFSSVLSHAERDGLSVSEFLRTYAIPNKEAHAIVSDIYTMLNAYNYDGSDAMTDYFDRNFLDFVDLELV